MGSLRRLSRKVDDAVVWVALGLPVTIGERFLPWRYRERVRIRREAWRRLRDRDGANQP